MTYLALRISGVSPTQPLAPVYSTWDLMSAACRALYPLTDNVSIYVQGANSFGGGGDLAYLSPFEGESNSYTILITTDPGEVVSNDPSSSAIINGAILIADYTTNSILRITKIKSYNSNPVVDPQFGSCGISSTWLKCTVEDCFVSVGGTCLLHGNTSSGFKNCTFALSANMHFAGTQPHTHSNCVFVYYRNLDFTINFGGGTLDNCTFYNYGSGVMSFGAGTITNKIEGNPNFSSPLMVSENEAPANVIVRDERLTALSATCLDNANLATATATDILDNPRGGM